MIFPNSATAQNLNHIPQFFNPSTISLPFAYNGAQINYRDSSWLKLNVCESFLNNECPNIDNCSLAHPPNTVKIENNKVTVCYDYIKKKECKHGNCKYYHPHDALASAILRRGDDTKKNGSSLASLGMTMGIRSPLQVSRPQDLFNMHTQGMLSSHLNNNNNIIADPQMKVKLEVMRQINAASGPQAWLPGLNIASAPVLVQPSNQTNSSIHSLLPGVTAKGPVLNSLGSMLSTAGGSLRQAMLGIVDPDPKAAGAKRPASDAFGSISTTNSHLLASNDNSVYGLPDLKKVKPEEVDTQHLMSTISDQGVSSQYYIPAAVSTASSQLQSHMNPPSMNGSSIPNNFNILQSNPLQTSPLTGYHQLGSYNVNNLFLQSMLANNQSMANTNSNLDALLALSGQKLYAPVNPYMAQMPLINQIYYQQLMQNPLAASPQILYPGSINMAELQQRSLEETSVAFINDKGTILEALPVCKDFLQGKCKRNQSCNYVHLLDSNVEIKDSKLTVCKNALKGQCHRPVCKFYHIPTYQLQKLGLHAQTQ